MIHPRQRPALIGVTRRGRPRFRVGRWRSPRGVSPLLVALAVLAITTGCSRSSAGNGAVSGGGPWGPGGERPPAVVSTTPVTEGGFEARQDFVGTLRADARADLYAKVPGQILVLHADTGDSVSAGMLLAQIEADSQEQSLEQARASLRMSEATLVQRTAALEIARATARRTERLAEERLVPDQQRDVALADLAAAGAQVELARAQIEETRAALQAAEVDLERTRIRAPWSGVIGKRYLDRGARAGTNEPVFTLLDLSPIRTSVALTARDAARLAVGQEALVSIESLPGRPFRGQVARFSSLFDPQTHTTEAEIEIDNPEGLLKPGMFATVMVTFTTAERALLVPTAAVVEDEREIFLMVAEPDGEAGTGAPTYRSRRVPVERLGLGTGDGGTVAVLALDGSLAAGAQVITLGQGGLADGAPVIVAADGGSAGRPVLAPTERNTD